MSNLFINTHSGKHFDYMEQKGVCINDIAYALSNLCRFCGHPDQFYTVAHHSIATSDLLSGSRLKTLGLLHDAHEAYLNDMPTPAVAWINILSDGCFKKALKTAKYIIDKTIFEHFGIDLPSESERRMIKDADVMMFEMERSALGLDDNLEVVNKSLLAPYLLMDRFAVRQAYLERFDSLGIGNG